MWRYVAPSVPSTQCSKAALKVFQTPSRPSRLVIQLLHMTRHKIIAAGFVQVIPIRVGMSI